MLASIEEWKPKFVEMQEKGEVFMMRDLPPDHPALKFAHKVNPDQYWPKAQLLSL